MDAKELEKRFIAHDLDEAKALTCGLMRSQGHSLAKVMVAQCPESRELSRAITKLEEAVFWANASIARNE